MFIKTDITLFYNHHKKYPLLGTLYSVSFVVIDADNWVSPVPVKIRFSASHGNTVNPIPYHCGSRPKLCHCNIEELYIDSVICQFGLACPLWKRGGEREGEEKEGGRGSEREGDRKRESGRDGERNGGKQREVEEGGGEDREVGRDGEREGERRRERKRKREGERRGER